MGWCVQQYPRDFWFDPIYTASHDLKTWFKLNRISQRESGTTNKFISLVQITLVWTKDGGKWYHFNTINRDMDFAYE